MRSDFILDIRRHGFFNGLRYGVITLLVGDIPIVMNVKISRPQGYEGSIALFPCNTKGIFSKNYLAGKEDPNAIIQPWCKASD
jgi:hypothetical protein